MDVIAGIDWASEEHRLCLVDSEGRRLLERRVSHDEEGLSGLCRLLGARGVGGVAVEKEVGGELERFWPGAARIFADVDSPIGLAFCERYPSPEDARGLGEKRLQHFLSPQPYNAHPSPPPP